MSTLKRGIAPPVSNSISAYLGFGLLLHGGCDDDGCLPCGAVCAPNRIRLVTAPEKASFSTGRCKYGCALLEPKSFGVIRGANVWVLDKYKLSGKILTYFCESCVHIQVPRLNIIIRYCNDRPIFLK